jgi:aminomethyltransferase
MAPPEVSAAPSPALKHTPLYDTHVRLGGKIVPFAGYELPVQYPTGITAEHKAVRTACGMFDVSHMGEFIVRGARAVEFADHVTTNHVAKLDVGQAQYSTICNERGTIEDDCLVYRFADGHLMMVVNGSNKEKDLAHVQAHAGRFGVTIEDRTDDIALIAVQGPRAQTILQPMASLDLASITYYRFAEGTVGDEKGIISRTGYTGEDGFELYVDASSAAALWQRLLDAGVIPCGLGSRDSLRLEAGLALYGNDIDDTTTPLEANLGWLVKLQKGDFVGRDALVRQKEQGIPRRLVGFTTTERAFPRHGYPVFHNGAESGVVRSGTMSPTLEIPIGTCYLPATAAKEGTPFEIEIRGKRVPSQVVKLPFYRRPA